MQDHFSSVESMLRWQISLLRSQVIQNREGIIKAGEVFPSETPKNWAFGSKKPHELAAENGLRGLKDADDKLDKAEQSLSDGDSAMAVYLLIEAQQKIHSSVMLWYSSQASLSR
jgi:hypothetical protein